MSTPRDFTITLAAATVSKIEARGRFFGIIEAPAAALDVQLDNGAPLRRGPGGSIMLQEFFSRVALTSALAQNVRVLIADDVQDVSNVITGAAAGVLPISETPASAVSDLAPVVLGTAAEAVLFAALATRRRISVHVDSANLGSCYARPAGASVNNIAQLQPGVVYNFYGTYGLDVRNDTGGNATFYLFEESGP